MTTWRSCDISHATASCVPPISRRSSAAPSIAPTIASPSSFTPATSTVPAPSSTGIRSGSAPLVYALADRGARLLTEHDGIEFPNPEWSRKNREARRPFIEHQLEIVDFHVALQCAAYDRRDVRILHPEDIIAAAPPETQRARNPFALKVKLSDRGTLRNIGLIPDLVFGLMFSDGSRRFFMVEIDRGTMPIVRRDITQTSFEKKMRAYLAAHAAEQFTGGISVGKHFVCSSSRPIATACDP